MVMGREKVEKRISSLLSFIPRVRIFLSNNMEILK